MKLLVVRNAFSYDFGGAERLAVHIAENVMAHGWQAVVASCQPRLRAYAKSLGIPNRKALWWSRQNWSGTRLVLFPFYLIWQVFLFVWHLQLILRERPHAVHLLSKDDFIAGTFAAKLLSKPVIWTDCADLKYVYQNHRVWYKNPVGKLVYFAGRFADAVTLVSNSERKLIEHELGHPMPANYSVVYLSAKQQQVTPLKRAAADKNAVIFCATSRLVIAKGIGELVDAFNKLAAEAPGKYRLWIVGDGNDEAQFKEQAGDNPDLVFVGHSDAPLEYVAAADIFVHPSHHEGFSLSIAEAAMLGKPMVVCNVGGNPELVNDNNGIVVPVRDSQALYKAMKMLGADTKMRKVLGGQARKDYQTKFDFDMLMQTKVIPLYEK